MEIIAVWGCTGGTEAIMIKPVADREAAEAPLAQAADLAMYAQSIVARRPAIPSGSLSLPHGLTPLPLETPQRFIAEPYVATDRYTQPCACKPHRTLPQDRLLCESNHTSGMLGSPAAVSGVAISCRRSSAGRLGSSALALGGLCGRTSHAWRS